MNGNGDMTQGCASTRKATSQKVKRLCTERQGSGELDRGEKQFVRPSSRNSGGKMVPSTKVTPSKLKRSTSLISIDSRLRKSSESVSNTSVVSSEALEDEMSHGFKQDLLKWRVLYSFSKNICKKKKEKLALLMEQLYKRDETLSKLSVQISLLKTIIRNDETVRETWKKRLQDVKQILTSALNENQKLKDDIENVSANMEEMRQRISHLETENNNYRNTHILLKSECASFEQQLKKERDSNSLLRNDSQLQVNKLNNEMEKKTNKNRFLTKQLEDLERSLEDKSFIMAELECNLQNTTRLWQNSVKEIHHLNKETTDLRKTNRLLYDELTYVKSSMSLLENNQQQIYKYFNMNVDSI